MINYWFFKLYCVFSIKSCWPLWVVVVGRCVVVTVSCVVVSGSIWWWLHKSPWQQPPVSESSGFPLDRRPKIELAWTCKLSQTWNVITILILLLVHSVIYDMISILCLCFFTIYYLLEYCIFTFHLDEHVARM